MTTSFFAHFDNTNSPEIAQNGCDSSLWKRKWYDADPKIVRLKNTWTILVLGYHVISHRCRNPKIHHLCFKKGNFLISSTIEDYLKVSSLSMAHLFLTFEMGHFGVHSRVFPILNPYRITSTSNCQKPYPENLTRVIPESVDGSLYFIYSAVLIVLLSIFEE